jgi:SSS family transporter
MTPISILICVGIYSLLLFFITWLTSRNANNSAYFLGNKTSPWYVVAYGMIGASLSGVTFMSVPGWVGATQFSYLTVVFGYLVGYAVIATVLLPLYYRLQLTSIYSYLEQRFGTKSYRTGAFFFLLSRTIGASFRMFLVVMVLQAFVFDALGVPFIFTVAGFITLILLYTYEGGIKTIIWTDTLQTTFMLLGVVISVYLITKQMQFGFGDMIDAIKSSEYSKVLFFDFTDKRFFLKQFVSGAFIAIVMTGLDQEMMQKNLSCKNIGEAQKNMFTFSIVLVFVNFLFLCLGALLFIYAKKMGIEIPAKTDELFPLIAIKYLGPFAGLVFIIGLISAAYPSADGALTSLTTSFCIDFLDMNKREDWSEEKKKKIRYKVHFSFAFLLLMVIVLFRAINDQAVVGKLFTVAGYTYGPLLGLYAFGLFLKRSVKDQFVPYICLASPLICYVLSENSVNWMNGYKFGFELLILNGLLTFTGLWMISNSSAKISNKPIEKL